MYVFYVLIILFLYAEKVLPSKETYPSLYLRASTRRLCFYPSNGKRMIGFRANHLSHNGFKQPSCISYGLESSTFRAQNNVGNYAWINNREIFNHAENLANVKRQQQEMTVEPPVIQTLNGKIRGVIGKTSDGQPYFSYRGIPYAMPPILEKRFAPPEPYTQKWDVVRNMTSYKSGCIGLDHEVQSKANYYNVTGEEDCLYLNVHMRGLPKIAGRLKTVIFFIHGGGFSFGSPQQFEATYLMDVGSIIYVNPAYRLGPLGFLSTGDEVVPGNNGLKDQVLALSWVKDNIESFGGNPAKIQIVGVDAGGASVHFMFLTPLTTGLFTTAYSISGTVLSPWAFQNRETAVQRTKTLAKFLNCTTESSTALVQCLQGKTAFDVVDQLRNMKIFLYNPFALFTPVDDSPYRGAYFPENPLTLLKDGKAKSIPWLVGFAAQSGFYPLAEILAFSNYTTKLEKKWHEYLPSLLFYNESCTDVAIALRAAYGIPLRNLKHIPFTIYATHHNYFAPIEEASIQMAEKSSSAIYIYHFNYANKKKKTTLSYIIGGPGLGISSGDDAAYIFKRSLTDFTLDASDKNMSSLMVNLLITFAETGRPSPSLKWKPKTKGNQQVYEMTGNSNVDQSLYRTRYASKDIIKYDYLFQDCTL